MHALEFDILDKTYFPLSLIDGKFSYVPGPGTYHIVCFKFINTNIAFVLVINFLKLFKKFQKLKNYLLLQALEKLLLFIFF